MVGEGWGLFGLAYLIIICTYVKMAVFSQQRCENGDIIGIEYIRIHLLGPIWII